MASEVGTGPMPVVRGNQDGQRAVRGDWSAPSGGAPSGGAPSGGAQYRNDDGSRNARPSKWESRYRVQVIGTDVAVVAGMSIIAGLLGYGAPTGYPHPVEWGLAAVTTVLTLLSLAVWGAWEPRVLGQGSEEFSRILRGVVCSLVVMGLAGLALSTNSVRPWTFGVIPLSGLVLAAARYGLRRRLHNRRAKGLCAHRVLAVGTPQSIAELVVRTRNAHHFGWEVAGACTANGFGFGDDDTIAGVPVVGDMEALPRVVEAGGYRVVAVTPAPDWSARRLHRLAWDLEASAADIVVDPGLLEVAGPRLHVKPVDGLPLLRLTEPRFSGVARVMKGAFDRVAAVGLLVLLLPVLLAIVLAVRVDGGPAFFRQTRVGRNGRTFRMIKFRSMVVDAEKLRVDLLEANEGSGPLFKMRSDPRVTAVGRWLRRYSLDELPQLFNVLRGSMSIVGPRPPLPDEVAAYSPEAHRRLHVRPGLTGLWQVSGRSNLSWEETVRLDLRYVENWSLALDALILWKTIGAVVKGDGAY